MYLVLFCSVNVIYNIHQQVLCHLRGPPFSFVGSRFPPCTDCIEASKSCVGGQVVMVQQFCTPPQRAALFYLRGQARQSSDRQVSFPELDYTLEFIVLYIRDFLRTFNTRGARFLKRGDLALASPCVVFFLQKLLRCVCSKQTLLLAGPRTTTIHCRQTITAVNSGTIQSGQHQSKI